MSFEGNVEQLYLVLHAIRDRDTELWNGWRKSNPHTRINLRGVSLSGLDLSNLDFSHADLTGADLSGTYLHNTNLRHACLSDADLRYAGVHSARCVRSDLRHAHLDENAEAFAQEYAGGIRFDRMEHVPV